MSRLVVKLLPRTEKDYSAIREALTARFSSNSHIEFSPFQRTHFSLFTLILQQDSLLIGGRCFLHHPSANPTILKNRSEALEEIIEVSGKTPDEVVEEVESRAWEYVARGLPSNEREPYDLGVSALLLATSGDEYTAVREVMRERMSDFEERDQPDLRVSTAFHNNARILLVHPETDYRDVVYTGLPVIISTNGIDPDEIPSVLERRLSHRSSSPPRLASQQYSQNIVIRAPVDLYQQTLWGVEDHFSISALEFAHQNARMAMAEIGDRIKCVIVSEDFPVELVMKDPDVIVSEDTRVDEVIKIIENYL